MIAEREGVARLIPIIAWKKDANAPFAFCLPHQAPNPRTIYMSVYLGETYPPDG